MSNKAMRRYLLALYALSIVVGPSSMLPSSALSQTTRGPEAVGELEHSFQAFLQDYWHEIRRRNAAYLKSVHPKLPEEAYDFFFDVTLQMMRFSDEQDLDPAIECEEFKVCRVTYPQPNDSWAAQRFILHENAWRWLDQ